MKKEIKLEETKPEPLSQEILDKISLALEMGFPEVPLLNESLEKK